MRRSRLISYLSTFMFFVIVLNLFAGTVFCIYAWYGSEQFSYSETENNNINVELELIKIPAGVSDLLSENFQKKNDHEILYHNKLYDVAKHVTKDGFDYYYCVNDFREEKMLEQIKQCTEANLDYFNSVNHSVPVSFKLFTQENSVTLQAERNLPVNDWISFISGEGIHQDVFLSRIFSPPELLVS